MTLGRGRSSDRMKMQAHRQMRALRLFTDRDDERRLLSEFFATIAAEGQELQKPIFSLYGVGGVGKTSLMRKAREEFEQARPETSLRFVWLDLDSEHAERLLTLPRLLWRLRCLIHAEARLGLHLFDWAYLAYMEKNHEKVDVRLGGPLWETIEFFGDMALLDRLSEALGWVLDESSLARLVARGIGKLRQDRSRKKIAEKLGVDYRQVPEMELPDLEAILPEIFAEELAVLLAEEARKGAEGRSLCIVLDGYERVPPKLEQRLVEKVWLPLLLDEEAMPRIGLVFAGRERLDWSAYDRALQEALGDPDERWEHYVDAHRLGGLAEADARRFLREAARFYRDRGEDAVAQQIERHEEAILRTTDAGDGGHHPFYLDLCLEIVERRGAGFDPARHLAHTPAELVARFLKYLDDEELRWHRALALAARFDEALARHLLDAKAIAGDMQAFFAFVARYAYVVEEEDGAWRFHRLMQEALIEDIRAQSARMQQGLLRAVGEPLLGFFEARLKDLEPASLTEAAARAFEHGNGALWALVRAGLLAPDEAYERYARWREPFEGTFLAMRESVARRWAELIRQEAADDRALVAKSLDDLARVLHERGDLAEAERLHREALMIRKEAYGDRHPDVARSLNNLANVLYQRGDLAEAERLYREALEVLKAVHGDRHPDVATSLNNLASVLYQRGDLAE
ncbi:MAG: tetratricopeptide repeat protein, partial [Zetaproteobacteria bacterium]